MMDQAVKRVLYLELDKLCLESPTAVVESRMEHPERDRVFVVCTSVDACVKTATRLEAMGFKIERASLPEQRYFNVHLSMEKLRKAVYEIKAAVEMPGDDVDDVRDQLIGMLNQLGARPLVLDVKVLIDRQSTK